MTKICLWCEDAVEGVNQKRYCSKRCKQKARGLRDCEKHRKEVRDYAWSLSPEHYCWLAARNRCRKSGLEFTIQVEDIPKLERFCPITGLEMFRNEGGHKDNSPTLDRIDTTKGYIPGNVRLISYKANRWKSDMSPEMIKRLYEYSTGKI